MHNGAEAGMGGGGPSFPGTPSWVIVDAALQPLLNLAERPSFLNALFAAGCIPPLLQLLSLETTPPTARVSAACILASLADSSLARRQLSREVPLRALLAAVALSSSSIFCPGANAASFSCQDGGPCFEVVVGLLYVMDRIASGPGVVGMLKRGGAAPLLIRLAHCLDRDVASGALQLVERLCNSGPQSGGVKPSAAVAIPAMGSPSINSHLLQLSSSPMGDWVVGPKASSERKVAAAQEDGRMDKRTCAACTTNKRRGAFRELAYLSSLGVDAAV